MYLLWECNVRVPTLTPLLTWERKGRKEGLSHWLVLIRLSYVMLSNNTPRDQVWLS